MNLCERIDFNLAKLLNNRIYADIYDDKYAAGDVTVTWDNYLGTKEYKEGEHIDDGDDIHGKYYYAPTYAEVIDWLFNKGIVIEFKPGFTFALNDKVAYYYVVYKINNEGENYPGLTKLFSDELMMSSFEFAMNEIIRILVEKELI